MVGGIGLEHVTPTVSSNGFPALSLVSFLPLNLRSGIQVTELP